MLSERFTRYFGVWRESDGGKTIVFDPLFTKGTALPKPSEQAARDSKTLFASA